MPGETNPVEQRIVALADKWKQAVENKQGRIISIHGKVEEMDMIDAFIWYMLGLDSQIDDIAFIIDPPFSDVETYSDLLLDSLDEIIKEWNESEKSEGIEFHPVDWKTDRSLKDKKNPASVFVRNFNNLAAVLDLEEGQFAVATLPIPHTGKEKEIQKWLAFALEEGIASNVRFLIFDTEEFPVYNRLADSYAEEVIILVPDIDMSNMLNQVAAMGDPADPSTPYRISFMRMMDAINKNREKETVKEGENCLRIALENQSKDPQWLVQVVVIHVALCQDQLRYKHYDKALESANAAVKTATPLPEILEGGLGLSVLAQAVMTRASVYCFSKQWTPAIADFEVAGDSYREAHHSVLALEAYRMASFCCDKAGEFASLDYLLKGFRLATSMDVLLLKRSTFPLLVNQLLKKNYRREISYEEIDHLLTSVYGEDWEEIIGKIHKKAPDEKDLAALQKEFNTNDG